MKRRALVLTTLSSALLSITTNAQPAIGWSKLFGGDMLEEAYSVKQTPDGGYISVGYTRSNVSGDISDRLKFKEPDAWVVKLNDTGKIEWEKVFGSYRHTAAYKVICTKDGGYLVLGDIDDASGDVSVHHGSWDLWVFKLDAQGNIEWDQSLGGPNDDGAREENRRVDAHETADGGFIIGTNINNWNVTGWGHNSDDILIAKLNANGDIAWQKVYGSTGSDNFGSIVPTPDGGYVVTSAIGKADGDVTGTGRGGTDWWVVKINDTGRIEWDKVLGGSGEEFTSRAVLADDGGYILAGITRSPEDGDVVRSSPRQNIYDDNIWVVKLDQSGQNIVWNKGYGGTSTEQLINLAKTNDGGVIISGATSSSDYGMPGDFPNRQNDAFLLKLDKNGNQEWISAYASSREDRFYEVQALADGGYVAAGMSDGRDLDLPTHEFGDRKFWIMKLDAPAMDSLKVSTKNNVPATITTKSGTLDLAASIYPKVLPQDVIWSIVPGTGTATIDANGVVTALTDGTVWGKAVAANNNAFADSIEITISGQTVEPEEPANVANMGVKLPVRIYPNPAANTIYLQLNGNHPNVTMNIINVDGKVVFQQHIAANTLSTPMQVNIASLPAGIYHVRIEGDNVHAGATVIKK